MVRRHRSEGEGVDAAMEERWCRGQGLGVIEDVQEAEQRGRMRVDVRFPRGVHRRFEPRRSGRCRPGPSLQRAHEDPIAQLEACRAPAVSSCAKLG